MVIVRICPMQKMPIIALIIYLAKYFPAILAKIVANITIY